MNKILTIIPFYNVEKYLQSAIESILQQTHKNIELVLVDDCSTDNSLRVAKSYEHLNNITILQNNKNKGTYYSVNKALYESRDLKWDFWQFHGADDMSDLTRYEKLLKLFDNSPNLVALKCTGAKCKFGTSEILIHPTTGKPNIYTGEGIAFYNRKVMKYLGYYDNTRFSGDTDYWWRLEALISTNPKTQKWQLGESKEILYVIHDQDNGGNITQKYNWHTDRPRYWQKIRREIETQMIPNNNFYRKIFE